MGHFSEIVNEFARLAKTSAPERVFLFKPKGGRFQFYITEPELLGVVKSALPIEYAPYIVTYRENEYLLGPESRDCAEPLKNFAGWNRPRDTQARYLAR